MPKTIPHRKIVSPEAVHAEQIASVVAKRQAYQEAGGDPTSQFWVISPEKLKLFFPDYFLSKILVDGWSKSYEKSLAGESNELSPAQIQNVKRFIRTLTSVLCSRMNRVANEPLIATAGNSAGVMKLISNSLEQTNCKILFALPASKDPQKYLKPSTNLVLQASPQPGKESAWGDELVGPTGIASTEFGVRVVFLIGGGENLKQQLTIYLDNALEAKRRGQMYIVAAVQGVGGISSHETLMEALASFKGQERYQSLFENSSQNTWLQFIDASDTIQLRSQLTNLLHYLQV